MNDIFDINRFLNLEKRNFLTHKNQFLYASLILIGYFLFSVLLFLLIGLGQFMVMLIYPLCFAVVACAPCFFERSMQKNNSIFDFILPGSTFEKFIVMILNYVIILPLICFGIVFLLVQLMSIIPIDNLNLLSEQMPISDSLSWKSFHKLLMMQSIFLTGYFFFKRFSFIKTLLIIVAVTIVLQIAFLIITFIAFNDITTFDNLAMMSNTNVDFGTELEKLTKIPSIIIGVLFPLGLWVVSFLKLREKEI